MIKRVSLILLFIVIVISIFSWIDEFLQEQITEIPIVNYTADMMDFDFDKDIARVGGDHEYYPTACIRRRNFLKAGLIRLFGTTPI